MRLNTKEEVVIHKFTKGFGVTVGCHTAVFHDEQISEVMDDIKKLLTEGRTALHNKYFPEDFNTKEASIGLIERNTVASSLEYQECEKVEGVTTWV